MRIRLCPAHRLLPFALTDGKPRCCPRCNQVTLCLECMETHRCPFPPHELAMLFVAASLIGATVGCWAMYFIRLLAHP